MLSDQIRKKLRKYLIVVIKGQGKGANEDNKQLI